MVLWTLWFRLMLDGDFNWLYLNSESGQSTAIEKDVFMGRVHKFQIAHPLCLKEHKWKLLQVRRI